MIKHLFLITVLSFITTMANAREVSVSYVAASDIELSNPHDLKLSPNGQELFVADVGNNRVAVLNPETLEFLYAFGADHQSGTHDVDFDTSGKAYIADTHNNRVTIYTFAGKTIKLTGELKGGHRGPEGILLHPNGKAYVAGAWSNNVVAYESGKITNEITDLSSPHDLEIDPSGDIWLADANNDRLVLLSPDLKIKRILSGPDYNFNGVRYMDILTDGTIIAADKNNHQIKFIDANGKVLRILGSGKPEQGENVFTTPEGVEVRGNTLWISDSGNDRVVKYTFEIN